MFSRIVKVMRTHFLFPKHTKKQTSKLFTQPRKMYRLNNVTIENRTSTFLIDLSLGPNLYKNQANSSKPTANTRTSSLGIHLYFTINSRAVKVQILAREREGRLAAGKGNMELIGEGSWISPQRLLWTICVAFQNEFTTKTRQGSIRNTVLYILLPSTFAIDLS